MWSDKFFIQVSVCCTPAALLHSGFCRMPEKLFPLSVVIRKTIRHQCLSPWAQPFPQASTCRKNSFISCSEAWGVNLFLHEEFLRIISLAFYGAWTPRHHWRTESCLNRWLPKEKEATRVAREYTILTTRSSRTHRPWAQAANDRVDRRKPEKCRCVQQTALHVLSISGGQWTAPCCRAWGCCIEQR